MAIIEVQMVGHRLQALAKHTHPVMSMHQVAVMVIDTRIYNLSSSKDFI